MKSVRPPASARLPIKSGSGSSGAGQGRIYFFLLMVLGLFGYAGYRLSVLTLVNHETLAKTAQAQYDSPADLTGRGSIYFSDLSTGVKKIAATNKTVAYLYSNNKLLPTGTLADIATKIINIVGGSVTELENKLAQRDKSYQILLPEISPEQAAQLKALKINGLTVATQVVRFYPAQAEAGQVLGFVGFDGKNRLGQYGVEAFYDYLLQPAPAETSYGALFGFLDFLNRPLSTPANQASPAGGSDLVLTIDKNIQSMVEANLAAVLKKWHSPAGQIIVQNPRTGEILALAASPSFDPNHYSAYSLREFLNPAYQEVYEPGSSFKPITMAAALDAGGLTPETTYNDSGEVKIGDYTIKNFDERAYGVQTMRQVLEKSLNTGAIFAQQKTGDDNFLNYTVGFGFGQKTGLDASGEVVGNIQNLYAGRKINFATAAFGQGVAVTPIQLINAYSAIANGGRLIQPRLVKAIVQRDGTKIELTPKIIGSPISEKTAHQIQTMLVDVVDRGFDKARITGYDIAGKTGTAQIAAPAGGYLENDQFVHNFVGFAPAYDAQFTVLIKMDRPQGIKFAADSLSPVFGDIARYLIRYFKIPPTRQ